MSVGCDGNRELKNIKYLGATLADSEMEEAKREKQPMHDNGEKD